MQDTTWIFELQDSNGVLGLHLILLPVGGGRGGVGGGGVLPLQENPRCTGRVRAAGVSFRRLFQLCLVVVGVGLLDHGQLVRSGRPPAGVLHWHPEPCQALFVFLRHKTVEFAKVPISL